MIYVNSLIIIPIGNCTLISQLATTCSNTRSERTLIKKTLVLMTFLFLASCNGRFDHGLSTGGTGSLAYASNGERIYFTGSSISGSAISASGGSGHMNFHMRMHGTGCVSCHGVEREGRRLWPQFWIKAPALTAEALFESDGHDEDGHGDHGSYSDESLRRAITQGIDPSGAQLNDAMPRWNMNTADLNDLLTYLKQSHSHD